MSSNWTGNPGSRPTENYYSVKAVVCPEAPWAGQDVNDYPAEKSGNLRNLTQCMWRMPDGRIAQCVGRSYTSGGNWHGDFYPAINEIAYSSDEGKTWTDSVPMDLPDPLLARGVHHAIVGDLMLNTVLPDGEDGYLVFATIRYDSHSKIALLLTRTKDFVTYSPWERTFDKDGYFVTNPARIIRLKSGRIIIPTALHIWANYDVDGGRTNFFYSDDNGKTWQESPDIRELKGSVGLKDGLQETGVVELNDGRLWAWARTSVGCQYQQFSDDGGVTWSDPEPSAFISPLSPLTIARMNDGRLVAVWNPVTGNAYMEPMWVARTPIVISVSSDEGKTWSPFRVLDDAPKANYSYAVIHSDRDGYLLVSYYYTVLGENHGCDFSKTKRIELSELE